MMTDTPLTKTEQAIRAFYGGDLKTSFHISKDFRVGVTKEDRDRLAMGYECLVRPDFYRQLGTDIQAVIDEARAVFQIRIASEHQAKCPQCSATISTLPAVEPPEVWECGCGCTFKVERTVAGIISVTIHKLQTVDQPNAQIDQLALF